MLAILHFFYGIVGNYGIAIIMLTVLVRGAMFPISYKQTQNMARMQALKPEMDRINEKYKTDMQKRSQATQELYRKHNINPLGGCLPVFLQLPIFIGLYRALMVDVELRQSPLFGDGDSLVLEPGRAGHASGTGRAFMPAFVNSGRASSASARTSTFCRSSPSRLFLVTQKMSMPRADERAGRDAAEDDEVHDDLHGPHVLQSGQRACACTSSPRACGASPSGSCCRRIRRPDAAGGASGSATGSAARHERTTAPSGRMAANGSRRPRKTERRK